VALAERASRNQPKGRTKPRIAPPTPARSRYKELVAVAAEIGIEFMPWQIEAARYLEAVGPNDKWLYPEVCTVVSRQNGKTEILVPHIVRRMRMGRRVMHTAQNRELPREVFGRVADYFMAHHRDKLRSRPRFANGQEEIRLVNGGAYRIVAPSRGGARGPSNDDLLIDELREMVSHDFIAAAKPTLMASSNPQVLDVSNAGEDDSVVLNAIRARAETDPSLAYLEWSASPERDAGDRAGWYESNPAIGHLPGVMENLEREYRTNKLAGTMSIFETEHLCRWVSSTREPLVGAYSWVGCRSEEELTPARPYMAVSMDPDGTRASVAVAWTRPDNTVGLTLRFNVTGSPIDTNRLGMDIRQLAARLGVVKTGFDPLTDAELVKYLTKTEPISGQKFANASAQFVNIVEARKLAWWDADAVTDDLTWTARKPDDRGSFEAVRAKDDRPIPASLAAVRAVWLASGPRPAAPRVM
jgi:hypothetical protein